MEKDLSVLVCGKHCLSLNIPRVMGIINVTPDSFYSESRCVTAEEVVDRAGYMVRNGVDIVDIGGYSTRPGADEVDEQVEIQRLDLAFGALREHFPQIMLSVDTFRARVVKHLFKKYGHFIVNDVSAGEADSKMLSVAGKFELPYIAMHSRGNAKNMDDLTDYSEVVEDVMMYLRKKLMQCHIAGIQQVILDPGFGFAKTVEQNYRLFNHIKSFTTLGGPVLVGISRKTMIWKPLGIKPENSLSATSALHLQALLQGASILRVHDVPETIQAVKLWQMIKSC